MEHESTLSWIAILIAAISSGGIICSFLLNLRVHNKENDRKYAEFLIETSDRLKVLEETKVTLTTKTQLINWFFTHLDILDQLAYLNKKKNKIPLEIVEYYESYMEFSYDALQRLDYDTTNQSFGEHNRKIRLRYWPHLIEWCKTHNISKPDNDAEWYTKLLDINTPI